MLGSQTVKSSRVFGVNDHLVGFLVDLMPEISIIYNNFV